MFRQGRAIKRITCFSINFTKFSAILSLVILILFIFNITTKANTVTVPAKKVIFGGDSEIPPYAFIDKNGNPAGFSVELAKAIAEEMGWEAEIKLGKLEDIRKELQSGQIDFIMGTVYCDERLKIYSFSAPYHEFRYSFFINAADFENFELHKIEELKPVAQKGSFAAEYIKKKFPGKEIIETNRLIETISYISEKRNSFALLNKYLALYLIKKYGIENLTPAGDPLPPERYHFVTLKNNDKLIPGLNEGLRILKMNGKYKTIYDKWFSVINDEKSSFTVVHMILSLILALLFMYLMISIWSWSLDKKIKAQTARLSEELERHKFSEKALLESEERSRLIIENAPLGIYHFNTRGEITSCNDSFVKIIGSSKEKLIGLNLLQLPDTRIVDLVKSAIKGEPGYYEGLYESTTALKSTHIRETFTPIKLADGTITGGMGIIEDNTVRKKYEEAILSAKEMAESASSIKSDFLANMSHEVRTPLNGILGMLQLVQTTGVNEEQSNYISIAIKSGMRLTRLLNDILDLSRVESDKLILNETTFSLKDIFSFINERYASECEERGVILLMKINDGTPDEVIGDEIRIRQILVNLVSNAVKFTKTGTITVNISAEEVSLYGALNIIISVIDTGVGIAEEMKNQIFEPFKQGEKSYRRTFQGAGLGLTLVKHIVNLMNGTIRIDSTPGKGTSVECSIMVKLPENQPIVIKPVTNGKLNNCGNQCTILVAEDERINRLALKRILEKSGYRILEAENGIEALKILDTEKPDCILMDIQMPEMDGIEATKNIRNRERYGDKSTTPIIALTAYTMPEDRKNISAAGLDDYISKPVNMDYLVKTISKFIANGNSK